MIEIIKAIWNLKWWEIFIIAGIDDVFFIVKSWFIWLPLIVILIVVILFIGRN